MPAEFLFVNLVYYVIFPVLSLEYQIKPPAIRAKVRALWFVPKGIDVTRILS